MASKDDVQKLAALARIGVSEEEIEKFAKEFDSILGYMGQLEKLNISVDTKIVPTVHNVFREDKDPHEGGTFTEKITAQFPQRDGDSLSVKQIISHD